MSKGFQFPAHECPKILIKMIENPSICDEALKNDCIAHLKAISRAVGRFEDQDEKERFAAVEAAFQSPVSEEAAGKAIRLLSCWFDR